jgi:hypothetical protein
MARRAQLLRQRRRSSRKNSRWPRNSSQKGFVLDATRRLPRRSGMACAGCCPRGTIAGNRPKPALNAHRRLCRLPKPAGDALGLAALPFCKRCEAATWDGVDCKCRETMRCPGRFGCAILTAPLARSLLQREDNSGFTAGQILTRRPSGGMLRNGQCRLECRNIGRRAP